MASFMLSFFPLDVLDGIWDLIESVSEGFLTYSCLVVRKPFFFLLLIAPGPVSSQNASHGARVNILGLLLRCNHCLVQPAVYQPT